jgi:hypothetical protein
VIGRARWNANAPWALCSQPRLPPCRGCRTPLARRHDAGGVFVCTTPIRAFAIARYTTGLFYQPLLALACVDPPALLFWLLALPPSANFSLRSPRRDLLVRHVDDERKEERRKGQSVCQGLGETRKHGPRPSRREGAEKGPPNRGSKLDRARRYASAPTRRSIPPPRPA